MDLEGLYKSRIEMRNAVSTKRIELRELELKRDKRLAIVPALRQKADVPALSLFN